MNIIPIKLSFPEVGSGLLKDNAQAFMERIGRALHRFGLPSHRLEGALSSLAGRLGYEGQFFATPTAIFMSFSRAEAQRTTLLRLEPGEINLDKLSRLDVVLRGVLAGDVSATEGSVEVDGIVGDHNRHGRVWVATGFTLASASASIFFGGGLREFVACAIVGLAIGVLHLVASRFERFQLFESTGALIAGFAAAVCAAEFSDMSAFVVTCGGVIVLVPGLSLTVAINELATRNLAAGTVRMANAMLSFLQIGFGVAVGLKLGALVTERAAAGASVALPDWTLPLALALSAIAFTFLLQAHPRDIGWIALASFVAFGGARYGSMLGGPEAGAFVGALTVGLASNLQARLRNRSAMLMLVPGIILIVPGSIGFHSISSMLEHDILGGLQFAFTMVMTGVALVTGLLIAGNLVTPRRSV
jgi:uncharacterized membrane protein YjjP (DUF1212 family)